MTDEKHTSTTIAVAPSEPGAAPRKGTLTFPDSDKHIILLMSNKMILGRDDTCDIVFDDTRISRKHALIAVEYDQAKFSDLHSSNGSFRAGERIIDDILLVNGDVLDLAHTFDLAVGVAERDEAVTSVSLTVGDARYLLFHSEIIFGGPSGSEDESPVADCVLPDSTLAPKHAQLEFLFDDVVISSLVDESPVIVDGAPHKSASLKSYTSFTIGSTTFVWHD